MKTLKFTHLIVALLLHFSAYLKAQNTLYVDNFHVGSVPFSSLQIALDSAKNGDIIMLQGSPLSYGNVAIKNKAVSIVGVGHHPKTQNAYTAKLSNIELTTNTKKVTLDGLVFDQFNSTSSANLLDITVRNCQINQSVNLGNQANRWLFYSNVFEKNVSIKSPKNAFLNDVNFANNFFYEPKIGPLGSSQNVRFGENLFAGNEVGKRVFAFQQISNVLIENNLFYNIVSFEKTNHDNSLKNNSNTDCDLSLGSKFEMSGFNPKFLDYKGGAFDPSFDFRNSTNVGLYKGKYEFSMTGEPQSVAQIRTLAVHNQSLTDKKLNFEVSFKADAAKIFSQNPSLHHKINNYLEKYATTDWKNITEAECFLDTDPGVGLATKLNFTAAATLDVKNAVLSFANTQTANGEHKLFIRVKNNQNRWSHLQSFAFFVEKTDLSMKLESVPARDCSSNTLECFKFILKNEGSKAIPAQNVDFVVFNKKATNIIPAQIGTIVPNGFAEFVICDKNKFLIEQDSVFVTLSSDYLNSHDLSSANQIVAIPYVRVDSLSLKVYDIRGTLCNNINEGRVEIKVENDLNLAANKYQWSYTTPEGVTIKYKHGFHLSLNTLAAGWHTAKAINPDGCVANTRFFVPDAKPLNVTLASSDYKGVQISCKGGNDGAINAIACGGTGKYNYSWSNQPLFSENALNDKLKAGTYSVTIADNNNCKAEASITLTEPQAIELITTVKNIACSGGNNDGAIAAQTNGGTGAVSFLWNNAANTPSINALAAGTYTVTATDENGCKATNTTTLTQPTAIIIPKTIANPACNGGTGTILIGTTGGTAPYTHLWSNGYTSTTGFINGLAAGTYTVTITDKNGCTLVNTTTLIDPTPVSIAKTSTNPACNGATTGTINITASGGANFGYTYNWGAGVTTQNRTGLAAGTYTVTVADVFGCTATNTTTLTQPAALTIQKNRTNPSCNGDSNGKINITPSGGVVPYTYNWGGGVTIQNRAGVTAGTYTVTVTDANGCTATNTTTLTAPAAITITPTVTQPTTPSNGAISIAATGGTSPFTYIWNDAVTTQNRTGLAGGTYTVTVTDANGCTQTNTSTLTAACAVTIAKTTTGISCNGGSNATISITPSGGVAPYTYNWGVGVTSQNRTGLGAGAYIVTVTDANSCTATDATNFTAPAAVSIAKTTTGVSCNGGSNATISITPSGGVAPYTYNWGGGVSTQNRTGLGAGIYTVVVTDANSCTAADATNFTTPAAITITPTVTQPTTPSNGAISIAASGGTGTYTYIWNDAVTTQNRTGLAGGTYTVTVTDANGCTASSSSTLTLSAPCAVTISASTPTTSLVFNTTIGTVTSGGQTGNLATRATRDGTVGVTCSATNYDGITSAGTYPYNAYTITNPTASPICVNLNYSNPVNGNQHAIVMQSPFVPADMYIPSKFVQVSGTSTGNVIGTVVSMGFNIPANSSVVLVVYDVNPNTTSNFTLAFSSSAAQIDAFHIPCHGGTKDINITPGGGTAPYTYNWGGGITTQNRTGLSAGTYTVTVTDNAGCSAVKTVTITQPAAPLSVTTASVAAAGNSTVTATPAGGTLPYKYAWNPNNGTADSITVPTTTPYTVTVTDGGGCTTTNMGTAKIAQINNNTVLIDKNNKPSAIANDVDVVKNDVLIAPNPASEIAKLNFTMPILSKVKVSVFDAAGRMIEQQSFDNSNAIELNLYNYLNGVYMVKIASEDGQKFVKRLIVQKY